jgi:predicted DNA binding CopG/RHH family protein
VIFSGGERKDGNVMKTKTLVIPKFKSESDEADWWASRAGRAYVKQKAADAQSKGTTASGSSLVAKLNQKSSIQIALRLPEADIAQARKLADRKGLGYQTFLKMLVHEGLAREARRG